MFESRLQRHRGKPPPGMPIHRSHWLAKDLALCVPFNEGAGATVHDYAQGINAYPRITSPTDIAWTAPDPAYVWGPSPVLNNYPNSTSPSVLALTNLRHPLWFRAPKIGFSYAALWKPLNTTSGTTRMMDNDTSANVVWYTNAVAAGTIRVTIRDGANASITNSITFAGTPWILAICTIGKEGCRHYVNLDASGNQIVGMRLANTFATATVANSWNLGETIVTLNGTATTPISGSAQPQAHIAGQWVWDNLVFTQSMADAFYADPWQMFAWPQSYDEPTFINVPTRLLSGAGLTGSGLKVGGKN